jgi:hypothetical protein
VHADRAADGDSSNCAAPYGGRARSGDRTRLRSASRAGRVGGERSAAPGARCVSLRGDELAIRPVAVTRRQTEHLPTVAFLRAISRTTTPRRAPPRHAPVIAIP